MKHTAPNILLVDDAPENIDILVESLKEYKTIVALNGEKAIELADAEDKPDLILLDIIMPGIDGFEVCRRLKGSVVTRNIPIIFITSENSPESISKGFKLGGVDYVTKPFQEDELKARVETHLELKFSREKIEKVNEYLQKEVEKRTLELQELNTELEEAKENLENLDMAKSQFLNMISHEIRTPLNGIIGATDIMKSQAEPGAGDKLLWLLEESVRRLEKFSMTALNITNLTLKKEDYIDLKKHSIKEILLASVTKFNRDLQEKSIKITYHNFEGTPQVLADFKILKRCFDHILENAIKFSIPYSEINIFKDDEAGKTCITIEDRGEGFSEQSLKLLYKPFQPGEKHVDQSVGLGLYYVKLAAESLNGTVEAGNNETQGAYVKLCLNSE